MIGLISTEEFSAASTKAIEHLFKCYGEECLIVTHPFSRQYFIDMTAECSKVLICGRDTLTLFFKVKKLEHAKLRQFYLDKPYYFTTHPNHLIKRMGGQNNQPVTQLASSDFYRELADCVDFVCNTPVEEMVRPAVPKYHMIMSPKMIDMMVQDLTLLNVRYLVLDIETTGTNLLEDYIRMIGIAASPHRIYVIPRQVFTNADALRKLKSFLEDPKFNWAGQNAGQFDVPFLRHYHNIDMKMTFDTMLAHYCLDERQGGHSLDTLAAKYFQVQTWKDMVVDYATVDEKTLADYLALDLHFQYKLVDIINTEMQEEGGSEQVHDKLLVPGAHVFGKAEEYGCLMDKDYLLNLNVEHQKKIYILEAELEEMVGHEINPQSWQQVSEHLYEELGLEKKPTFKSSNACTDEQALVALNHPTADKILELRRYKNINGLFVVGLLSRLDVDNRIRPSYRLFGTGTGRLSCSDPNLFNIPSTHHDWWCEDFNIKKAFIASPGKILIEADESQVELRIAGWYSRDEYLLNAYLNNEDIHKLVASMCYNVPTDDVTKIMRTAAKKIDFGAIYSIGPRSLREQLMYMKIFYSTAEVKELQQNFLGKLKGFTKWKEEQYKFVQKYNYIETPIGRRRRFPYITDTNLHSVRRQAVNTPIQSLASDITFSSIIELDEVFDNDARILLSVYDSILMEVPENEVDKYIPLITEKMTQKDHLLEYRVPFAVDIKVGKSWGDMHEYIKED